MKTFSIVTFGCRTNQAESRLIGEQLADSGYFLAETINSDIVIINACAVTHKAEKEVNQYIRKVERENPKAYLVVTGCFPDKTKTVAKKDLLSFLKKQSIKNDYKDKYFRSHKAIVKIQDGCNNFCSYCIVPYLRGRSQSRSIAEVIKEIRQLETRGIKEIILTGIDIADYKNLVSLLETILEKTKIEKISFGSININAFTQEFIKLIKNNPRITKHFHIPLQSGCDATLKRMKRKYSFSNFEFRISNLKKKIQEFSFSTDIIVGFPGETDMEFSESLKCLKNLKSLLTKLHVFRYSSRSGTVAAKMESKWGKVDFQTKKQRALKIKELDI